MNKLLQTMLVSAVMATSGMDAQGMARLQGGAEGMIELQGGGEVQKGAAIDFAGQTLKIPRRVWIPNGRWDYKLFRNRSS